MEKRNFLKGASVLLIAAIMVLSTFAVTANTNDEEINELILVSQVEVNALTQSKNKAPSMMLDWLKYHDDYTENSLGLTSGGTITMAITLTDAELAGFRDADITQLEASIGCDDYGFDIADYDIWIEQGLPDYGDVYTGGVNIVYSGTSSGTGWDIIDIPDYAIPDTGDVTIGFNLVHLTGLHPCGIDETNTQPTPRANHITYDGFGSWSDLVALGFPGVWGISVGIEGGSPPIVPDLDCDGTLDWVDVTPEDTVTGSFTVENIGDPTSLLDWEIDSYPDWGTWTFTPNGGTDLTPEDGAITVDVEVVAPADPETNFTGEVVLVNSEDASDTCIIDVSLATPVSQQSFVSLFFEMFAQRFPILAQIIAAIF